MSRSRSKPATRPHKTNRRPLKWIRRGILTQIPAVQSGLDTSPSMPDATIRALEIEEVRLTEIYDRTRAIVVRSGNR